jgi:hypothetical protein
VKKLKQESLKKKDKPLLSAHVVVKTGGAKVPTLFTGPFLRA